MKTVDDLDIAKGEVSSSTKRAEEAEEKARRDVDMAVRRYKRTKAFRREADVNYLVGLNECRATIMKAHPEVDFTFIASAIKTAPYPNFQVEGEGEIAPLVPLDDEYKVTIDTEESEKKRHCKEKGEEVEQPVPGEASQAGEGGEAEAP